MIVSFHFRMENKDFDPSNVCSVVADVPFEGSSKEDLKAILEYAWSNGIISKGTHRSGVFEVQTDHGIWSQVNEKKIDLSTEKKSSLTTFQSWDEWEANL